MYLSKLFEGLDTLLPEKDVDILDITTSSEKIANGSLFVAIKGVKVDGHNFCQTAKDKGAIAILAERFTGVSLPHILVQDTRKALGLIWGNFLNNPANSLKLLGITGTNGKTTSTYLTQYILSEYGFRAGLIGTIENITGFGREEAKYTTPEPAQLQALLLKMKDSGITHTVMEVSSHSLSQDRIAGLTFEVGAFTNLTRDHLDYHLTMENYLNEKLKLMDISKKAVINLDDPYGKDFVKRAKGEVFTYGINNEADFKARHITHTPTGSIFKLSCKEGEFDAFIGIPGQFSVYNALCSLAVCSAIGVPVKKAVEILKGAKGVIGRMELVNTEDDFSVIIDYAHTPDGLQNALETLKEIPKEGRLIVLFGCGGDRDKTKRPIMGKIACELADFVIITSDNPRTEEPMAIIEDILVGIKGTKTEVQVICDRKEAIFYALQIAKKGDILLLAGKGHETYQILKDKTIHFDEREIIRQARGEKALN